MREIKFRAWNRKKKIMYQPEEIHAIYRNVGVIAVALFDNDRQPVGFIEEYLKDFDELQFTGQIEKNGKGIYEGDIMKVLTWDIGGKNPHGLIIWKEGHPITYEDANTGTVYKTLVDCYVIQGDNVSVTLRDGLDILNCKKVGNIYENPELLGGA